MNDLLFDLDGTLTNSGEGITKCIQYALQEVGKLSVPLDELNQYVGPPLPGLFATLLSTNDPAVVEAAIAAYRVRFESVGIFENALYPGIAEALAALTNQGYSLCIVSAKPHVYSRRILEHFLIAKYFDDVFGPELGQRGYSKESLIRQACAARRLAPGTAVMIGDRAEDILGARASGLSSIAAAWGFGSREELVSAGPDHVVEDVDELMRVISFAPWSLQKQS